MKPLNARQALILVASFAAISAIGGGLGLLVTNGLGLPLTFLRFTPFTSFIVPGIILGVVVGGSALAAMLLVLRRHPLAYQSAFGAGAIMTGWIISEVLLIRQISWLHGVYLLVGVVMMALAAILYRQTLRQSHPLMSHTATS